MNPQKKPPPVPCPSPEDGPLALILYRLDQLEEKVDELLPKLYQLTGAWGFIKLLGAFLVGAAIAGAFFLQHFHFS